MVGAMARTAAQYSALTSTAQVLPQFIRSQEARTIRREWSPIAMDGGHGVVWCYPATCSMERLTTVAVMVAAQSLASAPKAVVLPTCIASLATMESVPSMAWFCWGIRSMERLRRADQMAAAQCSRSILTGRALQICTPSPGLTEQRRTLV